MRAYLPAYALRSPKSLKEALALLRDEPGVWKPFAGGTDLMVVFETGRLAHRKFLNIRELPELRGVSVARDSVTLGALTTYTELQAESILAMEFPMLCHAASETGAVAIQNRGTLGGNIANASPAADSPPALLVYEAQVELVSAGGARWVSYRDFHTGYKKTVMRPDELLMRIRLPRTERPFIHHYRKVGTRRAQAISKVCFAGVADLQDGKIREARIAYGSIAPTAIRCPATELALQDRRIDAKLIADAQAELEREIAPIDDIRSTAGFRRQVALNLLAEFLTRI